jgi:uncharacterized membrane protein YphA (DoxX/SURF4 family)
VTEPEWSFSAWLDRTIMRIFEPQPLVRLELVRILAPLAILGFMSSRLIHADDWLSDAGFRVPHVDDDWRQVVGVPGIPVWAAWGVAVALVVSALATSAGLYTRISSAVFTAILFYVALADRLAAFTVSKISPVIVLVLVLSPAGTRWSIDAWRKQRRDPAWRPPDRVTWGPVRFFQVFLPVFYLCSGLAKYHGAWRTDDYVLWSHLHDSYQTWVSWFLANHMPPVGWTIIQYITLVFELGAPLWFLFRRARPFAVLWALGMHAMIGLMFGPVIWFSLLMMSLVFASFGPVAWIQRRLEHLEARTLPVASATIKK